jgi:hypothetical protein
MLFQYVIIDIMNILDVIIMIHQVLGFLGLIIFGTAQRRNESKIYKPIVFTIIGLIQIVYLAFNERISFLILSLMHYYTIWFLMVQYALITMIPNIVSLITLGVLFVFLGVRNKQHFGKLLMYSGIFWIVFGSISIIGNGIILLSYVITIPFPLFLIPLMIIIGSSIFMGVASLFFVMYASKLGKKLLLSSSILLLVASILFAINSLLQILIYIIP